MAEGNNLLPSDRIFIPSAFAQAEELAKAEGMSLDQPTEIPIILEAEDIQGMIEFPFDVAALLSRFERFHLDEEESKRLARLFLKPVQRLASKTKNLDLTLAVVNLAGILLEKTLEYRIYNHDSARDEGKGKDQLSKARIER